MKLIVCKHCGRETLLGRGEKFTRCEHCGTEYTGGKTKVWAAAIAIAAVVLITLAIILVYNFTVVYITEGGLKYKKVGDGYVLNGYDLELSGAVEIPSSVNGKEVTQIGEEAFVNSKITSIIIPDTVKIIGKKSFSRCEKLEKVVLPANLEEIGDHAFYYCTALNEIELPSELKKIGSAAFYNCMSITSMRIPSKVEEIGMSVFLKCYSLKSVVIEANLTSIPYAMFEECDKLENVNIPDTVESIGDKAFFRCTSLKEIVIPESIRIKMSDADESLGIGESAFENCYKLEKMYYKGSEMRWLCINFGDYWRREAGAFTIIYNYTE